MREGERGGGGGSLNRFYVATTLALSSAMVYTKAYCKLELSVKSIHDEIRGVYGDKQMSFSTVYGWFTQFSSGHESVEEAPYSGRCRSAATKFNIEKISSIIEKDARFTVRQLEQITNLGLASVHFIL